MADDLKLPPGAVLVDDGQMKLPPGATLVPETPDFSANDNDVPEGTYVMSKDGKSLHVPFSKVFDAGKAGFGMDQQTFDTFKKHYTASLPFTDRIQQRIDDFFSPSGENTWEGKGLNVLKGTASGLTAPVVHPEATAKSLWDQFKEAMPSYAFTKYGPIPVPNKDAVQHEASQAKEIAEHPVYSASSIIGPAVVTHAVKSVLPSVPEPDLNLLEKKRLSWQNKFKGGEEFATKKVDQFRAGNEKARASQQHANEVSELSRGSVDTVNQERQGNYDKRVEDWKEKVEDQKAQHQERVLNWETKKARVIRDHQAEVNKVQEANDAAHQKWAADAEKINKENQAVDGLIDQREGLRKTITEQEAELQRRADAAEVKAKQENDNNWDTWRKKLTGIKVKMDPIVAEIRKAREGMNPTEVAEFNDILRETRPSQADLNEFELTRNEVMKGQGLGGVDYDTLPPDRKSGIDNVMADLGMDAPENSGSLKQVPATMLHGWKTKLEYRVRSARGNVQHHVGLVLDKVRAAEDQVSKEAGAEAELKTARASHVPYVQGFRESTSIPLTAKNVVLRKYAKSAMEEKKFSGLIDRLARYDPSIKELTGTVASLEKQLKDLPNPGRKADIPPPPAPKPLPMPLTDQMIEERIGRPRPQEPTYKKPPSVPSKKPYTEPKGRESTPAAEDWTPERIATLKEEIQKYGATGQWVWRLIMGSAIEAGTDAFMAGTSGKVGHFASSILIGQAALRLFSHVLSRDSVLDWMAAPSDEDVKIIDTLPPEDATRMKQAIKGLAFEASRQRPKGAIKMNMAPAIAAFLGEGNAERHQEQKPIIVVAPDGSRHAFQNQQDADNFKAAAGVLQ